VNELTREELLNRAEKIAHSVGLSSAEEAFDSLACGELKSIELEVIRHLLENDGIAIAEGT
jgi:hypothetical protein